MLFKELSKKKALLIGPGIGTEKSTREFFAQTLATQWRENEKPSETQFGLSSRVYTD